MTDAGEFGRVRLLRSTGRALKLLLLFAGAGWELLARRPATRQQRAEWLHRSCARAMRRMGVVVAVRGRFPERGAVISNHTGYLDIVTFAALGRCVFVSKAEIRDWPVLGWMTTMSGTVYVERGRGGSAARAAGQMREAAEAGLPVVFFPEGTTTNGRELLPFRSGVLSEALRSGEPVTAAYVRYTLGPGNDPRATVEDDVAYWGDITLLRHIFGFLGLREVGVEVRFAEHPIVFSAGVEDRKGSAAEARAAVCALAPEVCSGSPERSWEQRAGA